jgi:hypothetical protein
MRPVKIIIQQTVGDACAFFDPQTYYSAAFFAAKIQLDNHTQDGFLGRE